MVKRRGLFVVDSRKSEIKKEPMTGSFSTVVDG
jgi:hypothetical protein